jgi:hypothetical protein
VSEGSPLQYQEDIPLQKQRQGIEVRIPVKQDFRREDFVLYEAEEE